MLSSVSTIVFLLAATSGTVVVEGTVQDESGKAIPSARVFVEAGLGGAVVETQADAEGRYRFDDLRPGRTGFFSSAPGFAFGGRFQTLRIDEQLGDFDITLHSPGSVSGFIHDANGEPIPGAVVTRVGLHISSSEFTSIPLFKMETLGFTLPRSDANGRFTIPNLPDGKQVVLKVGHPGYAQVTRDDVRVGERKLEILLERGILIKGSVLGRDSDNPVPNAPVLFRDNGPPPASFVALSKNDGSYAIRLRPGVYFVKAEGATFRTQKPQRIVIADAPATQRPPPVRVAGIGTIQGKVIDVTTEQPIAGARIRHEAFGTHVAEVTTGPSGEYAFTAASGENSVRLLGAPGYLAPNDGYRILLEAGETETIPTIFLAPIPQYSLQVFDSLERPVPGAFVTLLRPRQLSWRRTDAQGKVTLDFVRLPADGQVIGLVEHPSLPLAAAFAIPREQADDAAVTLLPLGEIEGRVQNERGADLEGVIVEAMLLGNSNQILTPLWNTLTDEDGAFRWPGTIPHTAQAIIVYGKDKSGTGVQGRSEPFIVERTGTREIPVIELPDGRNQNSVLGKKLRWRRFADINDIEVGDDAEATLLFFSSAASAEAIIATAESASRHFLTRKIRVVVVLDEKTDAVQSTVPILVGENPTSMTTYLLDEQDKVLLETTGLPPIFALNNLIPVAR